MTAMAMRRLRVGREDSLLNKGRTQLMFVWVMCVFSLQSCHGEISVPLNGGAVQVVKPVQDGDVIAAADSSDVIPDQEASAGRIYRYRLPPRVADDASHVEVRASSYGTAGVRVHNDV